MAYVGKTIDENGKPVAGVKLTVVEPDQTTVTDIIATSGADGVFVFPVSMDLSGFIVDFSAPGFSGGRAFNWFSTEGEIVLTKNPFPWWILVVAGALFIVVQRKK